MSAGRLFQTDTPEAGNSQLPIEDYLTAGISKRSVAADLSVGLGRIGASATRTNWLKYTVAHPNEQTDIPAIIQVIQNIPHEQQACGSCSNTV